MGFLVKKIIFINFVTLMTNYGKNYLRYAFFYDYRRIAIDNAKNNKRTKQELKKIYLSNLFIFLIILSNMLLALIIFTQQINKGESAIMVLFTFYMILFNNQYLNLKVNVYSSECCLFDSKL